ncbi:hypothetical protein QTQ03_10150 [Micromonospora sp. WMMA1363]|uniref:hypothetical protein n=1 Tax=Micromonospora sp. WMMA1363 TaxID=3053985 RepID=UPI00259C8ACA|nr:hypothetical protein [Micromonospora sp. WMMA1363]MDM4719921.1 hypothetical protein [Micromonospora sp. WMMA1363]
MPAFADYAALARLLAEQRRAGERGAAVEAERRRDLHAAVDSLQHRLTAQGQRLDQLGRAIGVVPPAEPPYRGSPVAPGNGSAGGPPDPASAAGRRVGPPGSTADAWASPPGTGGPPASPDPGWPAAHRGAHAGPGAGATGTATTPGRPGGGPGGETALAMPGAGGVPGPRAGAVDPATELERARRYADEADRYGRQAELLAQRPPLLPTWSPVARATAVYLGCASVSVVLMLVMVFASGVGVVDLGTLYAWTCAGLPAVSLIAGWLVLGRWGRPAIAAGMPARYPVLGILVCFLALPLAYCGYLLLFRAVF